MTQGRTGLGWTEARLKMAAYMWREGSTAQQIAAALGVSRNAVIGKVHRNPDIFNQHATPFEWTDERLQMATRLWREGQSASHIGQALGISRRAVHAKAQRNPDIFAARRERLVRFIPPAKPAKTRAPQPLPRRPPLEDHIPLPAAFHIIRPSCPPVAFADLGRGQCKFPVANPDAATGPAMPCCGAAVSPGRVYCGFHCEIAYQRKAVR